MIVPFIMTMLTIQDRPYLWAFYKFLDLAKQKKGAIIAQEEYFIDPKEMAKAGRAEASNREWNKHFELDYELPRMEDFKCIDKYVIPKSIEENLIEKKGSINDAHICLLSEVIDELKELIGNFLDQINKKNKIDAVMTLCHNPSLSAAAGERGIRVIHFEMGTFREPTYLKTGYFDFNCLYGEASTEQRYNVFIQELQNREEKIEILDTKEILAIMLKKDFLFYLNHLNDTPKYELGIALGYAIWPLYQKNTFCDDSELLYRASKVYPMEQLLVRRHPGDPVGASYPRYDYCRDTSATTLDFILKCKRIASVGSNVSFESVLFGKTNYVLTDCPYTYKAKRKIEDTSLQDFDLYYINFFVFAYLVPFALLWDEDYIKWRLSNPTEIEIFKRHLMFYLDKKNISHDILKQDKSNRFHNLLKAQNYDLKADYAKKALSEKRIFRVSDYQKEIKRLKSLLEER